MIKISNVQVRLGRAYFRFLKLEKAANIGWDMQIGKDDSVKGQKI